MKRHKTRMDQPECLYLLLNGHLLEFVYDHRRVSHDLYIPFGYNNEFSTSFRALILLFTSLHLDIFLFLVQIFFVFVLAICTFGRIALCSHFLIPFFGFSSWLNFLLLLQPSALRLHNFQLLLEPLSIFLQCHDKSGTVYLFYGAVIFNISIFGISLFCPVHANVMTQRMN